jgi:hypothetical protein
VVWSSGIPVRECKLIKTNLIIQSPQDLIFQGYITILTSNS